MQKKPKSDALTVCLRINNKDKTEQNMFVEIRENMRLYPTININNRNFIKMSQFKYLVSILSEKNKIEKEITVKIQFTDCNYSMILRNHWIHEHCDRI